ncbi:TonB-dependent receptor domain-containing protein [Longitalea luteola]|uniref:TonB-dependent receptor domain-containing protein n=1 Tax=Longitalea luteola TaxID=2812563 RepID=UPI001A9607D9|nr:TonB-dependent receptor [Longitalea luteola]
MRFVTLIVLLLCTAQFVTAQNKISGKVVDAMNKLPLPDATVTIIDPVDSSAMGFAVVDKTGLFEIRNLKKGNYELGITFTGYAPYKKKLEITQAQFTIDMDTVFMSLDTLSMLGSVVVQAPPISVKKDTIEFRASSFKTKPNATVEDLLKKLPGVEVDKEGNITSQGEEITKIYVDGKEFFLNDPKLATKNLSSEMVEAVQVFDDMSDQAKFTKIDDGSRKRTINIRLKKDRKKGVFGRSSASIGSSDRYEGSASFNTFNNDRQVSILGGANNINRVGFTNNDLTSAMGGMGNVGGGRGGGGRGGRGGGGGATTNNGNTRSWSTGINYRDRWGSKVEFTGSYFVSQNTTTTFSESFRQNFFSNDSAANTSSTSNTSNTNVNHRFGFRLEYEIDSMNSLLITPTLNWQQARSSNNESIITEASNPKLAYKAIEGQSDRSNKREGKSFTNDLLFRHRFHKPGRTFTMGWNTSLNGSDGHGLNMSPYYFFNADGTQTRVQNRQQRNDQLTRSFNNTISTSVTEMIDSSMVWELNYAYTINRSNSDRDTYDYDSTTMDFDSVNKPMTNYFENLFTANRLGTNFRVKKEKFNYQFGGAVNFASLENLSNRATTGKDSTMRQTYTNFFPNASFNWNPKPRKNLRLHYRGSTRAPGINQLQDVQDISNPLNIRTGNPDLKQEFTHNINLTYSTFNLTNFLYVNINAGGSIINNKIVNGISTLDTGVLLTRPVNLNGAQSFNVSGTIGIPLKKITTGRRSPVNLNLTTTLRQGRDVSELEKAKNYNYTRSLGERISFNYFIQDKLDLQANASFNYNDARYSVQESLNYKYFDQHYSLDVTYTIFKRIMINNDFDYYINTGRAQGFNQPIPLWNAYVSCLLFRKQNGELRVSGIDLLNQNKSISRSVGDNHIEDTYTRVLQRFFLVSFMYNFKSFGKAMFPGRENRQRTGRQY